MSFDAPEVVRALHVAVFGTEPAAETFDNFLREIGSDPASLAGLAARLYFFAEKMRHTGLKSFPDHSQYGELRILLREIMAIGQKYGVIVDVGVLGRAGSNSYDLLTSFGWKGLLIEANPALIPSIKREFGPANYSLVQCAIGPIAGRQTFHLSVGDATSSLIPEEALHWGESRGEIEVNVRRLQEVLAEMNIPNDFDILDIDIEGMDVPVMNDLIRHSAYRPRLVVIEASFFFKTKSLDEVGLSKDVQSLYRILDSTASNLILGLASLY